MTSWLLLFCVAVSHGFAVAEFVRALRRGRLPSTLHFCYLSFVLYYDIGIAAETFGVPYTNAFFKPLSQSPDIAQLQSAFIIIFGPWLIKLGYFLLGKPEYREQQQSRLNSTRAGYFYAVAFLLTLPIAVGCGVALAKWQHVWEARSFMGSFLGPYIIVLSLPLYILAFFVSQRNSLSGAGRLVVGLLLIINTICVIPIGERTLLLLPVLILFLFYGKLTPLRLGIALLTGIAAAGLLLPLYKAQHSDDTDAAALVGSTISSDFVRAPILADVLERSSVIGTKVLRYPGEGYVYGLLFFVPRKIVPFKGEGSAFYYTAAVANVPVDELDWGLGISAIDEILLNFGKLFLIPGLLFWGLLMRYADRLSTEHAVAVIPTRLAAIWFLGYHLPALLQGFGGMAVLGLVFSKAFARAVRPCHAVAIVTEM